VTAETIVAKALPVLWTVLFVAYVAVTVPLLALAALQAL
jgi:hypothetical protein